ncbi:MAG: DUF5716 family protein [Lachnospiraceae bacterium]
MFLQTGRAVSCPDPGIHGASRYTGTIEKDQLLYADDTPHFQSARGECAAGLQILGFEPGRAFLQEYPESFYYETFSQKTDGRGRKIGLFVFEDRDVYFRKLDVDQTTRPALVSCREGKRVTLSVDERQKDLDFCDLIQESLGTDIYSTIYLVGNGFSQEWAKKSVVLLCKAQRKVYFGNNLYAKGACQAAREKVEDRRLKAYLYIGGDVVRYNVGMELLINGVPGYYSLIQVEVTGTTKRPAARSFWTKKIR